MKTPLIFNLVKKSIDASLKLKRKVSSKIDSIAQSPKIMEIRKYYEENEEEIQKISDFTRSAVDDIQDVLLAEQKNVISVIQCGDQIRKTYLDIFRDDEDDEDEEYEPPWNEKYSENWIWIERYFASLVPLMKKRYHGKLHYEPFLGTMEDKNKIQKIEDSLSFVLEDKEKDFAIYCDNVNIAIAWDRNVEEAKKVFDALFWEKVGNFCEINPNKIPDEHKDYFMDSVENEGFIISAKAEQLRVKFQKFLDKGISRSILFYGPPGTGKSNIVKNIASLLGKKTFRMNFSDIRVSKNFVAQWLNVCKPDIIIIEDIDHSDQNNENTLAILEKMTKHCKMLVATANAVSKLNDAIVRPGRFDELIEINQMDPEVLRGIVNNDEEVLNIVRDFPIASTMELMKRIEALGKDEALATMDDITQRLANSKQRFNCSLKLDPKS